MYTVYSIAYSVYLLLAHSVLYYFAIHIVVFNCNLINYSVIKHNWMSLTLLWYHENLR